MDDWLSASFRSSTQPSEEFRHFARDYKKAIKEALPPTLELVDFREGHFNLSGFIYCKKNGQYVYFSISDVRFGDYEWRDRILIRTAKGVEDFTGGRNHFTSLEYFGSDVSALFLT